MIPEVKVIRRSGKSKAKDFASVDSDPPSQDKPNRALSIVAKHSELSSIPDKIAGDKTLIHTNWIYPGAASEFPNEAGMHWVDKCYAFAKPRLLVDFAQSEWQIARCKRKAEAMKRLGHRYLYMTPNITMEQAVEQLGEL